jgi:transaldolase
MADPLGQLSDAGVSIWLDDLGRARLTDGSLAHLVAERYVTGVTTNPSIFARAITGSDAYEQALGELALRRVGLDEALRAITTADVRAACDVLRPAYDATAGVDGYVSIEVDPRLAHDTARTVAEAKALWWLVDRPNLLVKIPAAKQGLPAITACLAEGISINVTLIFSLSRYEEVTEAFLAGMQQARDAGLNLAGIASVASLFVSRLDTEIDARLDRIGTAAAVGLRGAAGIANARLAYRRYERMLTDPRWAALAAAGPVRNACYGPPPG